MVTIYQRLLYLYPSGYRREFSEEMCAVFQDASADVASGSLIARGVFVLREITGLLAGALHEHLYALKLFSVRSLLDHRRFNMRNGFRFPKSTPILMVVILLGLIVAIRKGEAIAYSLPHVSEPIAPIHPVHSGLLSPLPLYFACFYAAGLAGWAILFALRRSGVHRLDDTSSPQK